MEEEEDYKYGLDSLQDKFLDRLNEKELDIEATNLIMIEFVELCNSIARQMQYRVQNKIKFSSAFQESVTQIAHLKNIADILRKRLKLID